MHAKINHVSQIEEHVPFIDGTMTLRCVATNDEGVSHVYQKTLSLSEISSLEVGGHPQPAPPQIPPKTEKLTMSTAAYAVGEANAHFMPKHLQEREMELTIAQRPKGKKK
jgi:hypothetical protein